MLTEHPLKTILFIPAITYPDCTSTMATKYRICMHLYHIVSLASPWTATFQPRFNARFKKSMGEKTPTISLPRWPWRRQIGRWGNSNGHDGMMNYLGGQKNGWAALPKVSGWLKLMNQESIGFNLGSYLTRGLVPPMPKPTSVPVMFMLCPGHGPGHVSMMIQSYPGLQPCPAQSFMSRLCCWSCSTVSGLSVLQECLGCPGSAAEFMMNHLLCSENWWADIDITSSQA